MHELIPCQGLRLKEGSRSIVDKLDIGRKNAQLVVIIKTNRSIGYWINLPSRMSTKEYAQLVGSY